jgi:hypothetical protein
MPRAKVRPCVHRSLARAAIVGGVWLYETVSEEHCPHLIDTRRVDCPLCQGGDCNMCNPGPGRPHCDHDVLDRHHDLPTIAACWHRYTAKEFYRATLKRCTPGVAS